MLMNWIVGAVEYKGVDPGHEPCAYRVLRTLLERLSLKSLRGL